MNATMTVIIVMGLLAIGALGVIGTRQKHLSNWTVGERAMPRWTAWFLQAGESLTTFSFLGLAGIAYNSGVSAVYVVAYLTICTVGQYFVTPRLRRLGARHGYLTMADYLQHRMRSVAFGRVVAVVGALTLIPYLELQITGLGLIVQLATGSKSASGLSMVVASILVVLFVLWSGIRGIARVAIFKDFGMLIGLFVVAIAAATAAGGIPEIFAKVADTQPLLLTMSGGTYNATFFLNAVIITSIGSAFSSMPHLWPPVFAAKSGAVLRNNLKWLGLYQLLLFFPILVGMAAIFMIPEGTKGNAVLFTTALHTMPEWLVAVVAVFGAAAAMVPAAAIAMGISTLVSRNLLSAGVSPKARFLVNHSTVVVAIGLALAFGLAQSDISSLLLLTYGGTTQLVPGVINGLSRRVRVGAGPLMVGLLAGVAVVAVLSFGNIDTGSWDHGVFGLATNLVLVAVCELIRRARGGGDVQDGSDEPTGAQLRAAASRLDAEGQTASL